VSARHVRPTKLAQPYDCGEMVLPHSLGPTHVRMNCDAERSDAKCGLLRLRTNAVLAHVRTQPGMHGVNQGSLRINVLPRLPRQDAR
jgi:hypothetical protein